MGDTARVLQCVWRTRLPQAASQLYPRVSLSMRRHHVAVRALFLPPGVLLTSRHVYGIDCSSIIEQAKEIVAKNGFEVCLCVCVSVCLCVCACVPVCVCVCIGDAVHSLLCA